MKNLPIRTVLFTILIGSVVAASIVGVTAVLLGGFNDTLGRALWTILLAVVHSLTGLGYITVLNKKKTSTLNWSANTLFVSIMTSFLATVLGTWDVISGDQVWDTYQALIVVHFAVFHGEALASLLRRNKIVDVLIRVNYFFMAIVVAMLTIVIYADNYHLSEMFSRSLGAVAIIDGMLSLIIIILDRMFAPKHAKVQLGPDGQPLPNGQKGHTSSNDLVLIFVAVVLGLLQLFGGFFWVLFIPS